MTPQAAARAGARPGAKFIAGGTNLLDLMKLEIETPGHLVDVQDLGFDKIEKTADGGLRIGALVTNTDLAADERVRRDYAVLTRSIVAGASGQLRNKASTAGNLLQRTRCPYFYDTNMACNKRKPGSGCAAIGGVSRSLGIIGVNDKCIATFPGDMAVAMRVLDAAIETIDAQGQRRTIPIADFHRLWGDHPEQDTNLRAGELITAVTLPRPIGGKHFLREGARSCLLCLCAGVGRSRDPARRHRPRRVRRRRTETVAGRGGRSGAAAGCRRGCRARLPGRDADRGQPFQAAARHPRAGLCHRPIEGLTP